MDYDRVCWVCALKTEAAPIIAHLKMRKIDQKSPFDIYKDASSKNWLTISGIGQVNSSAATINLFHLSNSPKWSVWINIGVAGSNMGTYGTLFLVDKVVQDNTKNKFYLGVAKGIIENRASLLTVDKERTDYKDNIIFDMEGAGFVQTAIKLVAKELIVVLKIISDGPRFPIKNLSKDKVSFLVKQNIKSIEDTLSKFLSLSRIERARCSQPEIVHKILLNWKFSRTQTVQLKSLVNRVCVAKGTTDWYEEVADFKNAKDVILFLKNFLNSHQTDWSRT